MPSELESRHLRAFVTVVDRGGFTRAAEALGLSQSTVTEAVQALERTLGAPVLVKGKRRPTLTPVGEVLLPRAREVLAALEGAAEAVARASAAAHAEIAVGTSESISAYLLPPVLATLRRRWPGTRYVVRTAPCETVRAAVREGRLDLGLLLEGASEDDALIAEPLAPARLAIVTRPDHPWAGRRASIDALASTDVQVSDAAGLYFALLQRYFERAGGTADRLLGSGSVEGAKRSIAADPGAVGILPLHAVRDELERGALVEVPPETPLPSVWLNALRRRDVELPARAQALVDQLRPAAAPL